MKETQTYPIGIPGKKWGADQRAEWLALQSVKRRYSEEVLLKLEALKSHFKSNNMVLCPTHPTATRSILSKPGVPIPKR